MDLFLNAIVSGLLLGGFYAAVALGLAIAFGQLDIVNIAHPAFVIVGSYVAFMVNSRVGLDASFEDTASDFLTEPDWPAGSKVTSRTPVPPGGTESFC